VKVSTKILSLDDQKQWQLRPYLDYILHFQPCLDTWSSPDGKTHNQIDHILIYRRRNSSILDVRSFRAADCDTGHCLAVVKFRERLAVSK
jgi:hypothetical protein